MDNQIAKEIVEALAVGLARGIRPAQAPFADQPRPVALGLENLGNGNLLIAERMLAHRLDFLVAADARVSRVETGHERGARRRAHGAARAETSEAHAVGRELIQYRRLNVLLPVAPQVAVAQIISDDKHNVGRRGFFRRRRSRRSAGCQRQRDEQNYSKHPPIVTRADSKLPKALRRPAR